MQNFFRYTHYDKYIHLVIIIVLATLNIYFYYDINYWFDEWATFLVSDPNITLPRFFSIFDLNL